jgi:hypothetical protein
MRYLPLLFVAATAFGQAAEPAREKAATPATEAKPDAKPDHTITELGKKALEAMDAMRAAQLHSSEARRDPEKADQDEIAKRAKASSAAAKEYARAMRACLSEFFANPAHQKPIAGDSDLIKRANSILAVGIVRLKSGQAMWDETNPNCNELGMAYATAHKIEWLQDISDGGVKRYAAEGKARQEQADRDRQKKNDEARRAQGR